MMVVGGECVVLFGFEVYDVVVDVVVFEFVCSSVGFVEYCQCDVEILVGDLCVGDGLEYQIYWYVLFNGLQCICDVCEYVVLCWYFVMVVQIVDEMQQFVDGGQIVGGWVDVDDGIVVIIEQVV